MMRFQVTVSAVIVRVRCAELRVENQGELASASTDNKASKWRRYR